MDYGFASHLLLWLVGGITAVGTVALVGAFWSLGRSAYRD